MQNFEELQSYQPEFYKPVVEMQEILKASGGELDIVEVSILEVESNGFLGELAPSGVQSWSEILELYLNGRTLEESRSAIASTLKGIGKLNVETIKGIALAYKNGTVDVWFENSNIVIKYISQLGTPTNLQDFVKALDTYKPAHLGITFLFRYLLIKDIHEVKTLAEMETLTLDNFAGGED